LPSFHLAPKLPTTVLEAFLPFNQSINGLSLTRREVVPRLNRQHTQHKTTEEGWRRLVNECDDNGLLRVVL
jgi:hypothetical protein